MATITTTYKGDRLFETEIGPFRIVTDSRNADAPTAPQLFITSLGACVAAVVSGYCYHAGLDATGLTVDVDYEWADNPGRLTDIKVQVNLPNANISGREKALQRVATHYPVHETIAQWSDIEFIFLAKTALQPAV